MSKDLFIVFPFLRYHLMDRLILSFSLQFSPILQSCNWESTTAFECNGAVRRNVGDGDDYIYNDHFSTMAGISVWYCSGLIDIYIHLPSVAHIEGRGAGVWVTMRPVEQNQRLDGGTRVFKMWNYNIWKISMSIVLSCHKYNKFNQKHIHMLWVFDIIG